ncbi:MAG: hypothetical protein SNF33_06615 [Candidatus Algichlamydia australiensis]|nr:hypothetical protein [Chlamydiales bacterium]
MQIKVAQRFKPFSHTPGVKASLPWSHLCVQAFPTKIIVGDQELNLEVTGPVKNFTLIQDLERGEIRVFGTPLEGYFEFIIRANEWILSRCPKNGLKINGRVHQHADRVEIASESMPKKDLERLALGCHKEQEFVKMAKRQDMAEILPFWFFLGQQLPKADGVHPLLTEGKLEELFQVGFDDLFCPDFSDKKHLGMNVEGARGNRRVLLTEGAQQIRERFFKREGNRLTLLTDSTFSEGRFIDLQEKGLGRVHFEWTKHKMRRFILESDLEGEVSLLLPKSLKSCRLRFSVQERGRELLLDSPFFVQKGQKVYLDRFQK